MIEVTPTQTGPRQQCDICLDWTGKLQYVGTFCPSGEGDERTHPRYIVCLSCIEAGPSTFGPRLEESAERLENWAESLRILAQAEWEIATSLSDVIAFEAAFQRYSENWDEYARQDAEGH